MQFLTDFKVDLSDDIILKHDILSYNETEYLEPALRTAERRLVARYDDYIINDISTGIERYLSQPKTQILIENIKISINKALTANQLFSIQDYNVTILENAEKRKLNIIIKFNNAPIGREQLFKIIVDMKNQRVYRG